MSVIVDFLLDLAGHLTTRRGPDVARGPDVVHHCSTETLQRTSASTWSTNSARFRETLSEEFENELVAHAIDLQQRFFGMRLQWTYADLLPSWLNWIS